MPIYRSKYDPYDVNRKQPYHQIDVGEARVRVWKNETHGGLVWKFDVSHCRNRRNSDEISRGIPLDEARNAAIALQQLFEWQLERLDTRRAARKQQSRPKPVDPTNGGRDES